MEIFDFEHRRLTHDGRAFLPLTTLAAHAAAIERMLNPRPID
jgi:hypothetical protein